VAAQVCPLLINAATEEPATSECAQVLENCRKIDADFLLDALDRAFSAV